MWREGDTKILFYSHSPVCAVLLQMIAWCRIGGVSELGTAIERKGILAYNTTIIDNALAKAEHPMIDSSICAPVFSDTQVNFPGSYG